MILTLFLQKEDFIYTVIICSAALLLTISSFISYIFIYITIENLNENLNEI